MRRLLLIILIILSVSSLRAHDTVFLDGFPSVPLLEGFEEDADGRLIFDTVSGTISETTLYSQFQDPLVRYEKALRGLGWVCNRRNQKSECTLSGFLLVLRPESGQALHLKVTPGSPE